MVAAKIANLTHGGDRKSDQDANWHLDTESETFTPITQAKAANLLGVSEHSVQSAAKVQREAAPNVAAAVERGEVSVSAAAKAIKTAPKAEQETWKAEDIKKAAKAAPVAERTDRRLAPLDGAQEG
jgi:DNA-binding transcriptional regulator YdaS (Cro superfamily)